MLPNGAKVVDKRKKICYNYACVLNNPLQFGLTPYAERWLSGRRHTLGKRAYVNAYRGFESRPLRQSKPKSNTKVFGLGFSFAKIQVLTAFFGCLCAVVLSFSVFVWCVRIALSVAVADGFMPRKVLDVRKECVRLSCQRQTKSPFGAVGWRFICLPTRSAEARVKNTVE